MYGKHPCGQLIFFCLMMKSKLEQVLHLIDTHAEMIGLTIAEYLPFDEERLSRVFAGIRLFGD